MALRNNFAVTKKFLITKFDCIWTSLGLGIADGDDTIETFAYEICNTDGVDGLSWTEVEQCEVNIT